MTQAMEVAVLPEYTPEEVERFWSKVDRSGGPDACWPWETVDDSYGQIVMGGELMLVHRVSFFLTYGHFPEITHHTCQNKPCANPTHLQDMSRQEHGRIHTKLFCKNGHEFTDENTTWIKSPKWGKVKRCRKCTKENQHRWYTSQNPPKDDPYETRRGSRSVHSRLSEEDVIELRAAYENGEGIPSIAKRYGFTYQGILGIIKRKSWKHVP